MLIKACESIIKYTKELNAGTIAEGKKAKVYEMLQLYAKNLQQIFSDVTDGRVKAYNRSVYSAFQLLTLTEDHERLITTFITKEDFDVSIPAHRIALRRIAELLLANIPSNTSSSSAARLNEILAANETYRTSFATSEGGKRHSKRHRKQRRRYTRRQK